MVALQKCKMSDEEDTAILLDTDRTPTEKEIKISPKQDTYQDAAQNSISSQTQLILSSVVAIVSGICFGYDMGIAANLIKPISSTLNLNCAEQFYIASTWLLGAILSSIFGGFIIDTCGRRWSVLCSALLLIFSSILSSLPDSYALLLCSRLISGFSGPLSGISQCIYMSETSDLRYRGFRISLHQLGASLGGLLTCVAGLYIGPDSDTWRVAMGLNGLPALAVVLLTLIWLPRSPHFILYQRAQSVKRRSANYRITILVEIFIVAVLLIVFQQLSGRYTVFFYAPRLFSLLGICSSQAARIAVSTFSVVRFLSTCLCLCIVDRLGRRTSLIMSSTIMMTSVALLALLASIDDSEHSISHLYHENCHRIAVSDSTGFLTVPHTDLWRSEHSDAPLALPKSPPPYPMLPTPLSLMSPQSEGCPEAEAISALLPALRVIAVITLLLYEAAYALGFGTLTWVLLSELFPASMRGRGMCAVTCLHWLADFVVPTMFIEMGSSLGSTFLIYSVVCMISVMFTFFMVPETKNKTLHQVAQEIRNMSLATRIFQNLYGLPFFNNSLWLQQRAQQYRQQNRPVVESTII
ncbi:nebulosa [Carabus blaptoides fortunei]